MAPDRGGIVVEWLPLLRVVTADVKKEMKSGPEIRRASFVRNYKIDLAPSFFFTNILFRKYFKKNKNLRKQTQVGFLTSGVGRLHYIGKQVGSLPVSRCTAWCVDWKRICVDKCTVPRHHSQWMGRVVAQRVDLYRVVWGCALLPPQPTDPLLPGVKCCRAACVPLATPHVRVRQRTWSKPSHQPKQGPSRDTE